MGRRLRCILGIHFWDYIKEKKVVQGYGESYRIVGYYCVKCGVEADY